MWYFKWLIWSDEVWVSDSASGGRHDALQANTIEIGVSQDKIAFDMYETTSARIVYCWPWARVTVVS